LQIEVLDGEITAVTIWRDDEIIIIAGWMADQLTIDDVALLL